MACKKKKKRLPANLTTMEGNPTRELVSEMRGHLENILKDAELAAVAGRGFFRMFFFLRRANL